MTDDRPSQPGRPPKLSERALTQLGRFVVRRPGSVVVAFALAAIAALVTAAVRLELRADQNELVSTSEEYHRRYMEYLEDFGDQEFLYVVVRTGGDAEHAALVVDAVAEELAQLDDDIERVVHRIASEAFGSRVLLLPRFTEGDLDEIVASVSSQKTTLQALARSERFADVLALLAGELERPDGEDDARVRYGARFTSSLLGSMRTAADGGNPESLSQQMRSALGGTSARSRGYLLTAEDQLALVLVMPRKDFGTIDVIRRPLERIRAALERVRERFPGVEFGLTGRPVLQADEMLTTDRDMRRATALAIGGVLVLFVVMFRRLRRPLLAGVSLLVAIGLTFGAAALLVGYLTILSIVFAAMLVGLGIDFGIHYLARYQEELRAGHAPDDAVVRTLSSSGVAILTGGVTTSAAFFTAVLVDFKGLRELGLVAGVGVLLCLAVMLVLLPAIVLLADRAVGRRRRLRPPHPLRVPGLAALSLRPKFVLIGLVAATLIGLPWMRLPRFEFNLLELQARGLESVEFERLLTEQSDTSTWHSVFLAGDLEQVDELLTRLEPLVAAGTVGAVESVRDVVSGDQDARRQRLAPAASVVAALPPQRASGMIDPETFTAALEDLLDRLDDAQSQLARSPEPRTEAIETIGAWIDDLEAIDEALAGDSSALDRLANYQQRWFSELGELREELRAMLSPEPITVATLPEVVRSRYVSRSGRFAVYAAPTADLWQSDNMRAFVSASAGVDPSFTGTPRQVFESSRRMQEGFVRAALYSLAVVSLLLWLDFGSLLAALLALVPVGAGLFWLVLLMPVFSLEFNLANFFALPILIGCGVDGGVHLVHRYRETSSATELGRTTAAAVTLSFMTTMIGFGSLSIASHRGVASLGKLMVLGSATILVAAVVLLPVLLSILPARQRQS